MWALLAEAQLVAGEYEACHSSTGDAIGTIEQMNERYCEVEIHRVRGDCLAKQGDIAGAEVVYRQAISVALAQMAKSLELRVW